jgi:hypothetical protein
MRGIQRPRAEIVKDRKKRAQGEERKIEIRKMKNGII